jgi:YD repeat-containing protein
MRNLFWLATLFLLSSAACKKERQSPPASSNPIKQYRISTIRVDDRLTTYTYNAAGKLAVITDSLIGSSYAPGRVSLEYDNGKLSKVFYGNMMYAHSYPDVNTVSVLLSSLANPPMYREVFSYVNNRLAEYMRYDVGTSDPDIKTVFFYDNAGNIIKKEEWVFDYYQNRTWRKVATAIISYDDKVNLTSGLEEWRFPFAERNLHLVKNNPLKEEWFDAGNRLIATHVYQYEYDSKGRKVKRIEEVIVNNRVTNRKMSSFTYE